MNIDEGDTRMEIRKNLKLDKTRLLTIGLVCLFALMMLIAAGWQKVNIGFAGNPWKLVWLIEFNWVVASALLIVAVAGLAGGTWLCYCEGRQ
jgi:hypothetical protein